MVNNIILVFICLFWFTNLLIFLLVAFYSYMELCLACLLASLFNTFICILHLLCKPVNLTALTLHSTLLFLMWLDLMLYNLVYVHDVISPLICILDTISQT